jgi:hypothetical protein
MEFKHWHSLPSRWHAFTLSRAGGPGRAAFAGRPAGNRRTLNSTLSISSSFLTLEIWSTLFSFSQMRHAASDYTMHLYVWSWILLAFFILVFKPIEHTSPHSISTCSIDLNHLAPLSIHQPNLLPTLIRTWILMIIVFIIIPCPAPLMLT